jgi:hypothetical protein
MRSRTSLTGVLFLAWIASVVAPSTRKKLNEDKLIDDNPYGYFDACAIHYKVSVVRLARADVYGSEILRNCGINIAIDVNLPGFLFQPLIRILCLLMHLSTASIGDYLPTPPIEHRRTNATAEEKSRTKHIASLQEFDVLSGHVTIVFTMGVVKMPVPFLENATRYIDVDPWKATEVLLKCVNKSVRPIYQSGDWRIGIEAIRHVNRFLSR